MSPCFQCSNQESLHVPGTSWKGLVGLVLGIEVSLEALLPGLQCPRLSRRTGSRRQYSARGEQLYVGNVACPSMRCVPSASGSELSCVPCRISGAACASWVLIQGQWRCAWHGSSTWADKSFSHRRCSRCLSLKGLPEACAESRVSM